MELVSSPSDTLLACWREELARRPTLCIHTTQAPIDVHTQVCTVLCTAHIHKCTCIHRHVHLTPIYVYTHYTGMYSSHPYTCIHRHVQYSTAYIYIRVYTGLYTSHPYTCIHITQACTVSVHCTAHIHISTCIHRHVHLTPI